MQAERRDLVDEIPEYQDIIHQLMQRDTDFTKLYNVFVEIDMTIYRIEEGIEPSNEYTQTLKRQRALLRDEICDMLKTM